jgi:hypothetical protein
MSKNTTKRGRFEAVAARRIQKLLDQLDILGNCANRANYEYNEEDIRKMFSAIENKTRHVKALFGNSISSDDKNKFKF